MSSAQVPKSNAARANAGFSLLELLVSMTLLAMIGVLAASGIRFGTRAWERAGVASEVLLETHAQERFLRRQISAARPVRTADGTREPPVVFHGTPDSLSFLAPVTAALAPPGLHLVRIGQHDTGALFMAWVPVTPEQLVPETAPALENLGMQSGRLALRYYGPDPDGGTSWQENWEGRPALPVLVELAFDTGLDASRPEAGHVSRRVLRIALDRDALR